MNEWHQVTEETKEREKKIPFYYEHNAEQKEKIEHFYAGKAVDPFDTHTHMLSPSLSRSSLCAAHYFFPFSLSFYLSFLIFVFYLQNNKSFKTKNRTMCVSRVASFHVVTYIFLWETDIYYIWLGALMVAMSGFFSSVSVHRTVYTHAFWYYTEPHSHTASERNGMKRTSDNNSFWIKILFSLRLTHTHTLFICEMTRTNRNIFVVNRLQSTAQYML